MSEERAWAREIIHARLWSGYYTRAEIIEIIADEVFEGDEGEEQWLRRVVRREWQRKRAEEATWPTTTDCDCLDALFLTLETERILARHRCGLTIQDGLDVIESLREERGGENSGLRGYCFYHLQDMEGSFDGGRLFLAFGGFPPTAEQCLWVGQTVRERARAAGLVVDWNENIAERIVLTNFRWQRRSPGK